MRRVYTLHSPPPAVRQGFDSNQLAAFLPVTPVIIRLGTYSDVWRLSQAIRLTFGQILFSNTKYIILSLLFCFWPVGQEENCNR